MAMLAENQEYNVNIMPKDCVSDQNLYKTRTDDYGAKTIYKYGS